MRTRTAIRGCLALATGLAAFAAIAMPTAAVAATTPRASGGITPSITTRCSALGPQFANPGFESGKVAWTASPAVISQSNSGEPAHAGTWLAWLDGYGTPHTDSLSQTASITSACTATALNFWLHIDTAETTNTTAFDTMTVKVNGTTKATYSNLNHNNGYTLVSIPLSGVSGSATVTFTGAEDESLQTSFVIDDVALILS